MNKTIIAFLIMTLFLLNSLNNMGQTSKPKKTPANTFHYDPAASEISGEIFWKAVYGAPGFGEDPDTDEKDTIYLLVLNKKINVLNDKNTDPENINELNVDTVQLAYANMHALSSYKQKNVNLKGKFFHGSNAHHYTKVLFDVKSIN